MISYLDPPIAIRLDVALWLPQIYRDRLTVELSRLPPPDGEAVYAIMEVSWGAKISPITANYQYQLNVYPGEVVTDNYYTRVIGSPIFDFTSYAGGTTQSTSVYTLIKVVDGKINVNANITHYVHGYLYGKEASLMYHQDLSPSVFFPEGRSNYLGHTTQPGTDPHYPGSGTPHGFAELPAGFNAKVHGVVPTKRTYLSPVGQLQATQNGAMFHYAIAAPAVREACIVLIAESGSSASKLELNLPGVRFVINYREADSAAYLSDRLSNTVQRGYAGLHPFPANHCKDNLGAPTRVHDLVFLSKSGDLGITYFTAPSNTPANLYMGTTQVSALIVAVACVDNEVPVSVVVGDGVGNITCVKVPKDPYRLVTYSITDVAAPATVNLSEIDFRLSGTATKLTDSHGGGINSTPADTYGMFLVEDITQDERSRGATLPVLIYVKNSGAIQANGLALAVIDDNLVGVTVKLATGYHGVDGIEPVIPRESLLDGLKMVTPYSDSAAMKLPPLASGQHVGVWVSLDIDPGVGYNNLAFRLKILQEV